MLGFRIYPHESFPEGMNEWLEETAPQAPKYFGVANVGVKHTGQKVKAYLEQNAPGQWLDITWQCPLPVEIGYDTPATLGMDRVVGAIGAMDLAGTAPVLSIDAGTAITYDFIDKNGVFQGGGIAPGMRLRFRALDEFTAALPLVEAEGTLELVGSTTEKAIRSGVVNGLVAEIDGLISRYRETFGAEVSAVLTGGDAEFLGNHLKNLNFVNPFALLRGINRVLNYNQELNG